MTNNEQKAQEILLCLGEYTPSEAVSILEIVKFGLLQGIWEYSNK